MKAAHGSLQALYNLPAPAYGCCFEMEEITKMPPFSEMTAGVLLEIASQ
jgi:hypothetical protein